jgi:hypothetical protein
LWNKQAQTDRTIPNNKPDIIIRDNYTVTCRVIDVALSGDRHVVKKEAEKILKYQDIATEIKCMWNHLKISEKIHEQQTGKARNELQ